MEAFQARQARASDALRPRIKRYLAKSPFLSSGFYGATTDPEQIRAWWGKEQWPDALIGCPTGAKIGAWVFDVDRPKFAGDADGFDTLAALEAEHGALPETVEQRTGSGGRQLFFLLPTDGREVRSSSSKIGRKLDVRGEGGYIIVPPSVRADGGAYEWAKTPRGGTPFAHAPAWLLDLVCMRTTERKTGAAPVVELDQPEFILDALRWLRTNAPIAIEGAGGEACTFRVAARLRDLGVSEERALELLLEAWNDRCDPPWELDELAAKVANAFKYANLRAPGADTAEAAFAGCWVPPEAEVMPQTPEDARPVVRILTGADIMARVYPNRPLIDGLLDEGESLAILAANGLGKSLALLDLALTLADPEATTVWGCFAKTRNLSTLFFQSEVTGKALQNRLRAMMNGEPRLSSLINYLAFASFQDSGRIAGNIEDANVYAQFLCAILNVKPDVIIIDSLVSYHSRNENSAEMRHPLDRITALQDATGTAVIIAHHVGENSADKTVFKGRGSTAIGDWVANALLIERETDHETIRLQHVKARNFPLVAPLWLARNAGLRLQPSQKPGSRLAEGSEQAVAGLLNLGGQVSQQKALVDALRASHGTSETTAKRWVEEAVKAGHILTEKGGRATRLVLADGER